jgi:ubiquinone/menaquinone biosynthesis C-methylase UbiE
MNPSHAAHLEGQKGTAEVLFKKTSGFGRKEDEEAFKHVSTDEVRKYWDKRPCNSGWSFDGIQYGTREHWEEVTRRKYHVEYHIPPFAEFEKWKGKRVLEVGGGICTTAASFAEAGANITVVELSPKSMEMCKQRFEVMGLSDRATFYIGNAEQLSEVVPIGTLHGIDNVWYIQA